jgi:hypothetical protein
VLEGEERGEGERRQPESERETNHNEAVDELNRMTNGKGSVRREEANLLPRVFTRVSGKADVRRCVWVCG